LRWGFATAVELELRGLKFVRALLHKKKLFSSAKTKREEKKVALWVKQCRRQVWVKQCRGGAREARAQAAKMHLSSLTALPGAYSCMLLSRLHVVFLETLLRVCASHG
jgi:hypothetical protein